MTTGKPTGGALGLRGSELHQQHYSVPEPCRRAADFAREADARCIAEIGIYEGATSRLFAEQLDAAGELHLFDFDHRVEAVVADLEAAGHRNVVGHPNSTKGFDSYNWSLMKVLREHDEPLFDFVFLDGAHTWHLDALAFLLVDRMLQPGGHIYFDDYRWTLGRSPTMRPQVNPLTRELFTDEQIAEPHVGLVVDLLVRRDPRYDEVATDEVFRKTVR